MVTYTIPGMKSESADKVIALLQDRLDSLSDLALTLKHVHWNVIDSERWRRGTSAAADRPGCESARGRRATNGG